jgi:uncharacterized protein (TIGR03435 family)
MFNFELRWNRDETESTLRYRTVASAMEASLGLTLVPRKSEVEVIVIDHLERVPTAN